MAAASPQLCRRGGAGRGPRPELTPLLPSGLLEPREGEVPGMQSIEASLWGTKWGRKEGPGGASRNSSLSCAFHADKRNNHRENTSVTLSMCNNKLENI